MNAHIDSPMFTDIFADEGDARTTARTSTTPAM